MMGFKFSIKLLSIKLLAFAAFTTAATAQDKDKTGDIVARGEYLARAGDCPACHTAAEGRLFAGGRAMPTPFGTLHTSNITPDPETGIGNGAPTTSTRPCTAAAFPMAG